MALQVAQGQEKGACGMQYALGAGILDSCLVFGVLAIAAIGKCNLAIWIHASSRLAIGKQYIRHARGGVFVAWRCGAKD